MKFLAALFAGVFFGGGLLLSGMTDPANVLGFLDYFGAWRPQLAIVMAAAVGVTTPAFLYVRRRGRSLRGEPVELPDRRRIDGPLVFGSALFGIGWGLSGICPGPGIVLLATGSGITFIFMGAVIVGTVLMPLLRRASPG